MAARVALLGVVTNEEGKRQPVPGKAILTEHGWGTCRAKENVMCGGSAPQVVRTDPQAEANAAADAAAKVANADAAACKKRKKSSSLLASGAEGAADSQTALLFSSGVQPAQKKALGA